MDERTRCQSCAMILEKGAYGTESDGADSKDYCKYCYEKGSFTEPELTIHQAIRLSMEYMKKELKMEDDQAEVQANAIIPSLKRWRGK